MRRSPFALVAGSLLAGVVAEAPAPARADETKQACVQSYEQAQRLRLAGDLLTSRGELRVCSRAACPELVRRDCVTWLREVEAAIPSIVVSARTPGGVDQPEVRVFVDGVLAQPRLTGTAVEVNPGERKLRLLPRGAPPIEQSVLLVTGEKDRPVRVVIPDATRAPGEASRPPPPPLSIALAAIGLAAAGTGVALDLVGSSALRDLHATCAPRCAPGDVDATRTRIIAGDTLLGVGLVSMGAAVIYWLTRDRARSQTLPLGAARLPSFSLTF